MVSIANDNGTVNTTLATNLFCITFNENVFLHELSAHVNCGVKFHISSEKYYHNNQEIIKMHSYNCAQIEVFFREVVITVLQVI